MFVARTLNLRRHFRFARSFRQRSYFLALPEYASPRTAPTQPRMLCLAYFPAPVERYDTSGRGNTIEPTFIASSRKTTWEMGSFFIFNTFSRVYT